MQKTKELKVASFANNEYERYIEREELKAQHRFEVRDTCIAGLGLLVMLGVIILSEFIVSLL